MSPFDRDKTRKGLEACLRRLQEAQPRFAECAAHALGFFLEGPGDPINSAFHSADAAARFLGFPRERVAFAQPLSYTTPPMIHSGPYCLFLREDPAAAATDPAAALRRQLAALRPIFDALHQVVSSAPADAMAARLPARVSSWWEALFHLAVHFPTTFLGATRARWAAEAVGPPRGGQFSIREEDLIRFGGCDALPGDAVPGAVWVCLHDDVFASTGAAIELLLGHLTPPAARTAEPGVFGELHARFDYAGRCASHLAGTLGYPEPRLVKFASTFETGTTAEWCDYPMRTACRKLLLARCHGEAEYLLHRGTPSEDQELWAAAGAALPESIDDAAVMFSSAIRSGYGGYNFGLLCGQPFLNPYPAARWVRFVYNTLRGEGVEVRFRPVGTAPAGTTLPLYGEAVLNCDFDTASARAIRRAGLLKTPVAAAVPTVPTAPVPPPEPPDGPFEPFGFRYAGREADFATATLRYTLLAALWDAEAEKPFASRTTEQVLDLVYPDDEEAEAKLKNLKAVTNKALLRAGVPLAIRSGSAKHWLMPSP